jgi:hypothetical protein
MIPILSLILIPMINPAQVVNPEPNSDPTRPGKHEKAPNPVEERPVGERIDPEPASTELRCKTSMGMNDRIPTEDWIGRH